MHVGCNASLLPYVLHQPCDQLRRLESDLYKPAPKIHRLSKLSIRTPYCTMISTVHLTELPLLWDPRFFRHTNALLKSHSRNEAVESSPFLAPSQQHLISSVALRKSPAVASAACLIAAGRLPPPRASSRQELAARSPASQWPPPCSERSNQSQVRVEVNAEGKAFVSVWAKPEENGQTEYPHTPSPPRDNRFFVLSCTDVGDR